MSQYESPTRHMQYRSIFQIKSTSTEFKHEDTAQRRKGTVSAWRSQSGTCGGRDGRSSYPDSKSEKKMIEKKTRFRFTPCSLSCNNSTTGLAHFRGFES